MRFGHTLRRCGLADNVGNDTLNGSDADALIGGLGNDIVHGGLGLINGSANVVHGNDWLDGGDGDDQPTGKNLTTILLGQVALINGAAANTNSYIQRSAA